MASITATLPAFPGVQPQNAATRSGTMARQGCAIDELCDIDTLVRTYRARLLRFVTFSLGDADMAESITQDTFLKAYAGRDSFRGDCSVNTWLTSIAVNLIRDHRRLKKVQFWKQAQQSALDVQEVASFLPSGESSAVSRLIAREKVEQLGGILEQLSENQRTVFLMRFTEELSIAEIAETLDMASNTVKTHLHRALKAVRAQLGGSQP